MTDKFDMVAKTFLGLEGVLMCATFFSTNFHDSRLLNFRL